MHLERPRQTALFPAPATSLDNLRFEVANGERVALLGAPEGGRPLLRLLAGRLEGSVAIIDVESALDPEATGRQNLERLAGEGADEAAGLTGLGELLDVPVRFCSPGMRWRLGFAALSVQARPGGALLVEDCLRQADLAFGPLALARLRRLMDQARLAVVAEPTLFAACSRGLQVRRDAA